MEQENRLATRKEKNLQTTAGWALASGAALCVLAMDINESGFPKTAGIFYLLGVASALYGLNKIRQYDKMRV